MAENDDCEELLRKIERKLCGIKMQTSTVPTNPIAAMDLHYTLSDGLRFLNVNADGCDECKKLLEELERRLKRLHMQLADDRAETIDEAIASINIRLSR